MDPLLIAGILTVVLFVLLAAGLWVSLTLMLMGLLTMVMLDNNASGLIFADELLVDMVRLGERGERA